MKIKKFNKFGGTELRCKIQTTIYYELLLWILDISKDGTEFLSVKEWEEKYRNWCRDEKIYNYKKNNNISRFKMMLSTLMTKMEILKSIDGATKNYKSYVIKDEDVRFLFEKLDSKSFLFIFMQYGFKKEGYPFFEMIKFLKNNPKENKAKKLAMSFMVYDGHEKFNDLYNMDIPKEIAIRKYNIFLESNNLEKDVLDFKKPSKLLNFYYKIFSLKQENKYITLNDVLETYIPNKDKYFKPIFFKPKEKFSPLKFVDKINETEYSVLVKKFLESKYTCLLNEYLDLFNRWIFDLGISKSSSAAKCEYYDSESIQHLNNEKYYTLKMENKIIKYPYSIEEVNEFLCNISKNNFDFKWVTKYKDDLSNIGNSVLAEYFVNIKYCYLYNVEPINFAKYVNTKVTIDLFPIFTAPGGQPDMCFYNENIIHNIETTILKGKRENENNEIFPCLKHLKDSENKHLGGSVKDLYLTFITLLQNKEFDERFEHNFNYDFNFEDNRIKKLIINNFDEKFFYKQDQIKND